MGLGKKEVKVIEKIKPVHAYMVGDSLFRDLESARNFLLTSIVEEIFPHRSNSFYAGYSASEIVGKYEKLKEIMSMQIEVEKWT